MRKPHRDDWDGKRWEVIRELETAGDNSVLKAIFRGRFVNIPGESYDALCLLRTHHPALKPYKRVYLALANALWLVDLSSIKGVRTQVKLRLKLASCSVHGQLSSQITWGTDLDPFPKVTAELIKQFTQVGDTPEQPNAQGCIDLQIRRPGDEADSWTTVTHAWIPHGRTWDFNVLRRGAKNITANVLEVLKGFGYGKI